MLLIVRVVENRFQTIHASDRSSGYHRWSRSSPPRSTRAVQDRGSASARFDRHPLGNRPLFFRGVAILLGAGREPCPTLSTAHARQWIEALAMVRVSALTAAAATPIALLGCVKRSRSARSDTANRRRSGLSQQLVGVLRTVDQSGTLNKRLNL